MPPVKVRNRYLFLLVFLMVFGGTFFYMLVEKWTFLDSLFFCVVTLSTVGYGNIVPVTVVGKIFTMGYIIVGISVFLFFVNNLAANYGKKLKERQVERQEKRKSNK